jgi:hypothetical protein
VFGQLLLVEHLDRDGTVLRALFDAAGRDHDVAQIFVCRGGGRRRLCQRRLSRYRILLPKWS